MIISKPPYRISFFGGGTDYPFWYKKNEGLIIGTSIDKYCYITLRSLPPFFKDKHRLVWSKIETVSKFYQIKHPAIRECLKLYNIKKGVEIHHVGDLPARSRIRIKTLLFAVGLLSALNCYTNQKVSKAKLAKQAIDFEQNIIKSGWCSRSNFASHGGFLSIKIKKEF